MAEMSSLNEKLDQSQNSMSFVLVGRGLLLIGQLVGRLFFPVPNENIDRHCMHKNNAVPGEGIRHRIVFELMYTIENSRV